MQGTKIYNIMNYNYYIMEKSNYPYDCKINYCQKIDKSNIKNSTDNQNKQEIIKQDITKQNEITQEIAEATGLGYFLNIYA